MCTVTDVFTKDMVLKLNDLIASQNTDSIFISENKHKNVARAITNLEDQLTGNSLESDGSIGENAKRGNIVYIHQSLQCNMFKIDRYTNQSLSDITGFIACEIKCDQRQIYRHIVIGGD